MTNSQQLNYGLHGEEIPASVAALAVFDICQICLGELLSAQELLVVEARRNELDELTEFVCACVDRLWVETEQCKVAFYYRVQTRAHHVNHTEVLQQAFW